MQLQNFGVSRGRRKTLAVLGAGASRGASFVTSKIDVLPPLDVDFFQQISRLNQCDEALRLLEFVRAEYGHEAGLSMEQVFSEADYTHRFHHELNVGQGRPLKKYGKALEDFYGALAVLLNKTTKEDCDHHAVLAQKLGTDDTVLSFNYDCLMDRALARHAGNRWDPGKRSYGFDVDRGLDAWRTRKRGKVPRTSIQLLKMHGSQNWKVRPNGVDLDPPNRQQDTLSGRIIPPTWFKDLAKEPYSDIWKEARIAVRTARIIVVVGYSVPETDLFSRSLFKVEAGSKGTREKLDLLVLVNPDPRSRRRFIDIVSGGFEPRTRVLEFENLRTWRRCFHDA